MLRLELCTEKRLCHLVPNLVLLKNNSRLKWSQIQSCNHGRRVLVFSGTEPGMLRHICCQHWLSVDWHHRCSSWKLHLEGTTHDLWTREDLFSQCTRWPLDCAGDLQVTVNPNFHVLESDFTNNVVRCELTYTGVYVQTRHCRITRWDICSFWIFRLIGNYLSSRLTGQQVHGHDCF